MAHPVYDMTALEEAVRDNTPRELIDALDNLIMDASLYYLDYVNRGIPSSEDSVNIIMARQLLNALKQTHELKK